MVTIDTAKSLYKLIAEWESELENGSYLRLRRVRDDEYWRDRYSLFIDGHAVYITPWLTEAVEAYHVIVAWVGKGGDK